MIKSKSLIKNIGLRLRPIHYRCISYKLNVSNNYPALNTTNQQTNPNTKTKAYDDLLETLKVMYLREAQLKLNQTAVNHQHQPRPKSPDFEFVETEIQAPKESKREEAVAANTVDDENELIKKAKIQVQRLMNSFNLLIQHQRVKKASVSYEQLEFKKRHDIFNKSIKAYVDVCCNIPNLVDEAYKVVESLSIAYEKPPAQPSQEQQARQRLNDWEYISDVEIFNRVMFEVAKTGKVSRLYVLFRKMRSNKDRPIVPNLNSYAAVLQAFGYQIENKELVEEIIEPEMIVQQENISNREVNKIDETNKHLAIIRLGVERVLWDMKKANFSLEELSTRMDFSSEQQNHIKKAVNLMVPDFEFRNAPDFSKLNPLLTSLYFQDPNFGAANKTVVQNESEQIIHPKELLDKSLMLSNFEKQLNEEKSINVEVPSILVKSRHEKTLLDKRLDQRDELLRLFRDQITRTFLKKVSLLKFSKRKDDSYLVPFLSVMDKSAYVEILLQEAIKLAQNSEYFSASFNYYAYNLGTLIESKYHEHLLKKNKDLEKLKRTYEKYIDFLSKRLDSSDTAALLSSHREEWINIMRELGLFKGSYDCPWPSKTRHQVGEFLLEILLKAAKIPSPSNNVSQHKRWINAFYNIYRITGVYRDPQIKVDRSVAKILSSVLVFETNRMPMIVPPMPWYAPTQGGYFLSKSNLLRLTDSQQEQQRIEIETDKSRTSTMNTVYDSLNTLGACSWRVNEPILDLLIKIFNNGGCKELDVPEPAERGPQVPKIPKTTLSKEELRAIYKEIERANKIRGEMHSLWTTELYRLSIANLYRKRIIWFPHSLDFRGRAYPIPPHFNHLGSDIARSLILFGQGRALGPNGLDMLLVHLINLTGTMKRATIDERLEYARSILPDIIDSAERPLDGSRWWQKSEERWQTLACCMEIAAAIKSGDPKTYVSFFPVHQDGSCNGLQHYAALGRDREGAASVNLRPFKRPQDVYSSVLELVEEKRKRDEIERNDPMAKTLAGFIKRKTIKQTVMTTVYNVTFYGAKLQIQRQLEDTKGFPQDQVIEASGYIATRTFNSIRQLFTSAREIQDWFSECAFLIARVRNSTVKWETPLGLLVSQPYFRTATVYKESIDKHVKPLTTNIPDSNKQRNAFPPNFVHSLDSCHMMLTSLYCERAGINFVSVHDCFWTHPGSVDLMNKICREQFVALHSLPLLENLSKYFLKNYQFTDIEINEEKNENLRKLMILFNQKLASVPTKGEFDLNQVLESRYFFS